MSSRRSWSLTRFIHYVYLCVWSLTSVQTSPSPQKDILSPVSPLVPLLLVILKSCDMERTIEHWRFHDSQLSYSSFFTGGYANDLCSV
ncbi:hypothetical protein JH06_5026 [Blastocystis sp. subtype 4]|uniref:hypothetical protein n=1 Tax=Blastocystis sp. subtype 4 TaxID=944170 RepID=UPI00071174CD|nr:hypothetical protein JH06_5026 [Blastocystis sp. subtype 4]KNB41813.1 hypothetical protein JH06_5026 [Blastocystis sp. subtype 4]|eukprot:XP_014525256.1 hypothetical protein JH06_5026 [Blastocystis sp. subtype 4]